MYAYGHMQALYRYEEDKSLKKKSARRTDPNRRDRLIDVALDVIAEHGTAGTTHRKVAEAGNVPLGSMTYHFKDMEELLVAAFRRFTERITRVYNEAMASARTSEQATSIIAELLCEGRWLSQQDVVVVCELYVFAIRTPEARVMFGEWAALSMQVMEEHYPPDIARQLESIVGGLILTNYFAPKPLGRDEVQSLIAKITAPAS
jgi:DNA-binding transcriptional regulator YbjK